MGGGGGERTGWKLWWCDGGGGGGGDGGDGGDGDGGGGGELTGLSW